MAWGAQLKVKEVKPRQTTWGAQTKPSRGEIVKATDDGEVWAGTKRYNWRGKEKR
jgi:hypothetical protein